MKLSNKKKGVSKNSLDTPIYKTVRRLIVYSESYTYQYAYTGGDCHDNPIGYRIAAEVQDECDYLAHNSHHNSSNQRINEARGERFTKGIEYPIDEEYRQEKARNRECYNPDKSHRNRVLFSLNTVELYAIELIPIATSKIREEHRH